MNKSVFNVVSDTTASHADIFNNDFSKLAVSKNEEDISNHGQSIVSLSPQQNQQSNKGNTGIPNLSMIETKKHMLNNGSIQLATEEMASVNPVYLEPTQETVTKLIQRTDELYDARVRAENIIEAAMDAIITVDSNNCIVQYNKAAEKMFGYRQSQICGKCFFMLLPLRFRESRSLNLPVFNKSGKAKKKKGAHITLSGLRADGSEFPFEGSVSNATVNNQLFFSIIIRDISGRLQAEKLEKELNMELLHQNERLQQFEYMASHNLRGPVATILGLTHLLDLNNTTEPIHQEQIINYLKQTAVQLDSIVRDIQQVLDHQHRADLVKEEILLSDIVTKVTEDLEEAITSTSAGILCNFSKITTLYGTRTSLFNIFYQLFSNAIKFRNPAVNPFIVLESHSDNEFVYVSVSDNGLGLDLNRFGHKLFSPYSRFHTHVEGKGLGLHAARTLLRQMGGDIIFESNPNEGTICTIHIPQNKK